MYKNKLNQNSTRIAVKDTKIEFTYQELFKNSKRINSEIETKVVGIYMNKSAYYIQAIYYALISDITFIPLNPDLPKDRINFIIDDAGIETIIKTKDLTIDFEDTKNIEELIVSKNELNIDINSSQDEKYIIYTSGTTGNPKGCVLSDRGIDNVISQQIEIFKMNKSNIFLYLSINFDASLSDIFCSFYSESTLFINDDILKDKEKIISFFKENNITHVDMPPSFLAFFNKEELPTLENIVIGGEIPTKIDYFKRVVNVYGPTEATICTSYEVVSKDFEKNCIGKPLNGVEYKIVDGKLHIKSIQLFDGYKNMYNPIQDGWYNTGDIVEKRGDKYYFIGREDNQLKHNGNMINLDEIESKIKTINPGVFVKYENKEIILYTDKKIERSKLEEILPSYMIPHKQYVNEEGLSDKTRKKEFIIKSKIYDIFKEYDDYDTPLKDLGVDSLKVIGFAIELSEIGIEMSYSDLMNMSISQIENKDKRIYTEAELMKKVPFVEIKKTVKGNETIVVGASGFLGIHLVKELTKENNQVLCMVRSERKFYEMNEYFNLNIDLSKVIIYEGDVNKENFGMPEIEYNYLKENIGTIYFMAGEVNNVKSLEELTNSNIKTVENILRFKGDSKELIFASTLSVKVSVSPQEKVIDMAVLDASNVKVLTGYAQSKWIADKMVSNFPNVYIMRYGMLLNEIMSPNSFYTFLLDEIKVANEVPEDKGYSMDDTSVVFAAKETIKQRKLINNITENKKIFYKDLIEGKKIGQNSLISKFIEDGNSMNVFETTNIERFDT